MTRKKQPMKVEQTGLVVTLDPDNPDTVILSRWPTQEEKAELSERVKALRTEGVEK